MADIFSFFWGIFRTLWDAIEAIWQSLSGIIEGAAQVFNVIIAALGGFITWIINFFGGA